MKKAGDLLSFFFDEKTLTTAQRYAKLFGSWASIMNTQKIPAAAAHSRIAELERHIILIETDHPGWIQLLQTKQRGILHELQRRFPNFTITGISFRLSRRPLFGDRQPEEPDSVPDETVQSELRENEKSKESFYEKIQDPAFKETLKRLEKNIILRNRGKKT